MDSKIVYGLWGLILGGAAGAFITFRVLRKQVETELETALVEIKAHYDIQARKQKSGPYSSLDEMAKAYREAQAAAYREGLKNLGYINEEAADADPNFDKAAWMNESGFDKSVDLLAEDGETEDDLEPAPEEYTERDLRRNGDGPYVITYEEFSEEHDEFSKTSIIYYASDKTLSDEREEPIPRAEDILGDEALKSFGKGSHDKNVVYVRNENLGVDYEVVRNPGKYSVIILNQADEPPVRKPRAPRKMKVTD